MFSIDDFKSNYMDLSRQYLFLVKLDNPYGGMSTQDSQYLVQSSSLPENTIDPIEINWQGMVFPVGSTHTFSDWTITFRLDKPAELRRSLLTWMKKVHDPETNVHGSPTDYMQDQEVEQLDVEGNPVMTIKLIDAWPVTVGAVEFDYGTKEISTFDVTLRYTYHIEA